MKVTLADMLVATICLFLFCSLTYELLPLQLNNIIGLVLSFILVRGFFVRLNLLQFCLLLVLTLLLYFSCMHLSFVKDNEFKLLGLNDSLSWIFTSVFMVALLDNRLVFSVQKSIFKYQKVIFIFLIFLSALLYLFIFLDKCYSNQWNGIYFKGYSYGNHSCASTICLLMSLKLMCLKYSKKYLLIILLLITFDFYVVLQTGARIFVVPSSIILFLATMFLRGTKKSYFIKYSLLCILPIITVHSNFFNKFCYTLIDESSVNSYDLIDSISNSRIRIWGNNISSFIENDWMNLIIGNGFDFSYYVNFNLLGRSIWAHSDLVSVLVSAGILGLFIYLLIYINLITKIKNKFLLAAIVAYSIFPMIFNGFFLYQHLFFSFVFIFCFAFDSRYKFSKFINK